MFEADHYLTLLLFLGGLFAGTVDAVAGGGGLITLPLLLASGLDPHIVLGTNKLQATVGSSIAARNYYKHGLISIQIIKKGLLLGFLGASLGAFLAQYISSSFLHMALPYFMLVVLGYWVLVPQLGITTSKARLTETLFYPIFGFGLGFYDGFFGPAVGSFWIIALVFFLGYDFAKASAYTKVFNLKSNLIAAACFTWGGNINLRVALVMACGQFLGANIGSRLVIRGGARIVRPIFIVVVLATILLLFFQDKLFD